MKCPRCQSENPENSSSCSKCGVSFSKPGDQSKTQTLEISWHELAEGDVFAGRYQVLQELGRGGMGRVYKVFDKETKENLALKLLRPEIIRDEKTIERFRNELKIAHQLSHKNICRMYHLGREETCLYITMECVPGEDLRSFVRRSGQLSAGKAVYIAGQVCEGLGEAHSLGIVHRDLKPQNIMIDTDGNAKIMDFGIARSFQEEGLTGAGFTIGTPAYMAPEQIEGKDVDRRADIYALGVVLYEMLTGKPPFEGDTAFSVAYKHKMEKPPHPGTLNPLIPEELSRTILKCLEKDREKRFQDSAELCAALAKIQGELSGTHKRFFGETAGRERQRRRRALFSVTSVVLTAALISVIGYLIKRNSRPEWKSSIAVLPFEDLSADHSLEYLGEIMTDDIATKLGGTGELKVPSRRSTLHFKNKEEGPQEIGRKLGVATVLEATLQIQNNLLRVNVKLARTKDGTYIWMNSYTGKQESVLMLEDEISRGVLDQLGIEITAKNREKSKKKDPKDAKDYDVFMLGRHFEKRYGDYDEEEDFKKAVDNLKMYVEANPDYALAYWILGNVHEHRFALGGEPGDRDLMQAYYKTAYTLEPDLEETNLGMGWSYFYRQDYDKSYEYFKRAVELNPDNPDVNWNVGSFFRSISLDKKAIKYYEKALVSDPLFSGLYEMCSLSHMDVGEYEEGLSLLERGIALERENIVFHAIAARLHLLLKKYEEAEKMLARAQKLNPGNMNITKSILSVSALIASLKGESEKALSLLKEIRDLDLEEKVNYHLDIVSVYSLLGMNDEAILAIEEGIKRGFAEMKTEFYGYPILRNFPFFEKLKSDPRFKAIVQKQKKTYEMRVKKYADL